MVGVHVEQNGRHHAHDLLSRDQARISHLHHKLVDLFKPGVLFKEFSRDAHLEEDIVWVELLQVHSQLRVVNVELLYTLRNKRRLVHIYSSIRCGRTCLDFLIF